MRSQAEVLRRLGFRVLRVRKKLASRAIVSNLRQVQSIQVRSKPLVESKEQMKLFWTTLIAKSAVYIREALPSPNKWIPFLLQEGMPMEFYLKPSQLKSLIMRVSSPRPSITSKRLRMEVLVAGLKAQ